MQWAEKPRAGTCLRQLGQKSWSRDPGTPGSDRSLLSRILGPDSPVNTEMAIPEGALLLSFPYPRRPVTQKKVSWCGWGPHQTNFWDPEVVGHGALVS